MNKSSGPYMQQAGRGNMEKTGRGIPMEFQGPAMHVPGHNEPNKDKKPKKPQNLNLDQSKKVDIPVSDAEGKRYSITVTQGAPYHKMSQEMGGMIPAALRMKGLNESNDPSTTGISEAERQRRMNALRDRERNRQN